jgi:hypothetical protein
MDGMDPRLESERLRDIVLVTLACCWGECVVVEKWTDEDEDEDDDR